MAEPVEFADELEENLRIRITWGALKTARPTPLRPRSEALRCFLEAFQPFCNVQPRVSRHLEKHFSKVRCAWGPPGDPVKCQQVLLEPESPHFGQKHPHDAGVAGAAGPWTALGALQAGSRLRRRLVDLPASPCLLPCTQRLTTSHLHYASPAPL